jgi:hypothetical protein
MCGATLLFFKYTEISGLIARLHRAKTVSALSIIFQQMGVETPKNKVN